MRKAHFFSQLASASVLCSGFIPLSASWQKMSAMSWIRYDACQSYWRFEAPALVFSVVSASVLTVLVCFSRMCVDLLTRQGNRVYTVPLFCSVIPPNFVSTCIFAPITTHGLTLPNWLIMPSKCLSALIIKPTDPFLYLISVWNDHYHSNILMKQHRSRI